MRERALSSRAYIAGIGLVLAATVLWSLSGLFVRQMPDLTGWQINCWRGYWMSVFLLAFIVYENGPRTGVVFLAMPRVALVAGALFFAVGSTFYVTALTLTTVANVATLGALAPMFTALMSRAFTGERVNGTTWLAALVALGGVAVIMKDGLDSGHWGGNLFALGIAFCFAGQTITLRRYRGIDLLPAICFGGFLVFVTAGAFGGFDVPFQHVLLLAVMGPIQLAIPIIFYARGARAIPAVTLCLVALLDVLFNPLWVWMSGGEVPTMTAASGAALVIAAVLLSILGGRWYERRITASALVLPVTD
jgi:drug/metabolite transporter (DMT)-like permease